MVLTLTTFEPEDGEQLAAPPIAPGAWPADQVQRRRIDSLIPYARNARTHSDEQVAAIAASIREWGWTVPLLVDEEGVLIAGHGRVMAAQRLGLPDAPTVVARGWTDAQKRAYRIADNQLALGAGWDRPLLNIELSELQGEGFDIAAIGFSNDELQAILRGEAEGGPGGAGERAKRIGSLAARFLIAPFSVFNARDGWWQDRKRGWIALGLQSELGRGDNVLQFSETAQNAVRPMAQRREAAASFKNQDKLTAFQRGDRYGETGMAFDGGPMPEDVTVPATGTSIFDPVLCEVAYRWFCPPDGVVLDPFAGGSVRGIVAAKLGRRYVGVDLRPEQCEANEAQRGILAQTDAVPEWRCGDARDLPELCADIEADFILSCPPYADLERYSDDPRDLSTMEYDAFIDAYRGIVMVACARLRQDRFACFVVGDIRDEDGHYRGFVADTIRAFADAGLPLVNEAILVTMVGSLPIRAGAQFAVSRKLGKTHQNVLVFVKGDARAAAAAVGECEFGDGTEPAASEMGPTASDPDSTAAPPPATAPLGGEIT